MKYSALYPQKNTQSLLLNRIKFARTGSIHTSPDQQRIRSQMGQFDVTFGQQSWQQVIGEKKRLNKTQIIKQKGTLFSKLNKLNRKVDFPNKAISLEQHQLQNLTLKSKLRAAEQQKLHLQQQLARRQALVQEYLQIIQVLQNKIQQKQDNKFNLNNFYQQMNINENQVILSLAKRFDQNISEKPIQHKFQIISKTIDQIVMPFDGGQKKLKQQLKALQMAKIELQRKCMAGINSVIRKKEDEIDNLRKGFSKKLSYYKEMLIKMTRKPVAEGLKLQKQDIWQTGILETCEDDQL